MKKKTKPPTFSIVMPAYNAHATVAYAVDSILAQAFPDWELLICDDSSVDATFDLLQSYDDYRIHVLRNSHNMGTAHTRNNCLSRARGRYIAFLDADDWWGPNVLQSHFKVHSQYNPGLTYGDYNVVDNEGRIIGLFSPRADVSLQTLLKSCDIGLLTACVDRHVVGDFQFPHSPKEDYALWLFLCSLHNIKPHKVTDLDCYYRLSNNSISSNKWREIMRQWHVIRSHGNCSVLAALINISCYIGKGLTKHLFKYRAHTLKSNTQAVEKQQ